MLQVAEFLLRLASVDINSRDSLCQVTPLVASVQSGDLTMLHWVLTLRPETDTSLLMTAAVAGHLDILEFLISTGASVTVRKQYYDYIQIKAV